MTAFASPAVGSEQELDWGLERHLQQMALYTEPP